ncbi:MAG: DUF2605 domain-containing protein [Cyanobacteriota bacterium]|nr:DUF2605 domain-containing protein [Cyanobacteriota bacterium]
MASLPPPSPSGHQPAGELLDSLLGSLISDFRYWFARGQRLLELCPDRVMAPEQRQALALELDQAQRSLQAAVSLRQAVPTPMALELDTLAPWHQLMLKVWNLSAALRLAGVTLPEQEWPVSP